ncbi:tape measure protein [Blautia luti]|uniref:tape measure protein n=1 Tax=Blautia luti TaxID=89014 RepID=UPI0018AB58C5|nr:tape measure protein [Blautia luti]
MSKVVDSRVVEMRFDNAQFERNVKTTMSTLDKLKEKLKFSGASKGLGDIEKSAKQVDMSGLGRGVDTIKMKFSAMEVIAMTALSNITTTAMRVGKSIADALTIDPLKDGFTEYETQMNAVQTILANTQKEGTTVKDVNKALDELNSYADQTIYNFTEMTRNIGTFTAAGVKLDASVSAIKGIANLAAVSGSTSQQASTAMYQLSQALAAGKVQLMDWNSVVNAGMGGQVFQDALIRTSEHLGTGAKEYIEATGSFRNSLEKGWLTTDVLTQTLDQFATAADTQEEYNAAVKKFVDQGYTQEQAKEMADMAKTAGDAATKVKTFTQLIDTLKEALGSGWTKTWQLIIGDFEDAKEIWTKVSDVLSNLINKSSDARNKLVKKVMGNPYSGLLKSINEVTDKASGLQEIVNNVIRGDYGNGQPRFDKLTEQGYNWARVQNMVNEQLGCSFRYNEELGGSQEDLQKTQAETIAQLVQMSDAQLKEAGFTKGQIKALRGLQEQSEKTGVPIQDLINTMSQMSGRDLLFGSFENIGKSIFNLFSELKKGWNDVFNPPSAYTLYNILYAIYNKTAQLAVFTEDHGEELRRTMAGLAAVLDIIKMTVGGGLKFGIKALNAVLGVFGLDTLDVTANLGDLLVKFDKWMKEVDPFTVGFEKIGEGIKFLIDKFKDLYTYLNGIPRFKRFFDNIKDINFKGIGKNLLDGIKNFDINEVWNNLVEKTKSNKVGAAIINGFKKGLEEGITSIPGVLLDIGKAMLDSIKEILDINSPSKKMKEIGEWAIEGLFNGIKSGAVKILDYLKGLGSDMLGVLGDVDWGSVIVVGSVAGFVIGVKKVIDAIGELGSPIKAVESVIKGITDIEKSLAKSIEANTLKTKMDGIKKFAEALVIVAASIYILGSIDSDKLIKGGIATGIIAGILLGIAAAMTKITESSATINKSGVKLNGLKTGITSIGTAVLLIGTTIKLLGSMEPEKMQQGFAGLVGIIAAIATVYTAFGIISLSKNSKYIDKAGIMMKKMATAMLLMVAVVKLVGGLSAEEMAKGVVFASAFAIFVGVLSHIGSNSGNNMKELGKGIKSLVVAMGLLVGVVKLISLLSTEEMVKGVGFATAFAVFVGVLTAITKTENGHIISGLTGLLLSISVSMALMVGVVKMVSGLSTVDMVKGGAFVAAFVVFVEALIKATTITGGQQTAKIAGSILAVSIAIGIIAGIAVLLGMVKTENLVKGGIAVTALCGMMAIMVRQLRGANDVSKTMTSMAVAIGVMAGAVAVLSFIDTEKLVASTLALSTLMGMFAVVEKTSSGATSSLKTIVMMTAVVAALASILVLMNQYDFNASASNAAALSTVLLGLSAATVILGKVENVSSTAIGAVAGLALIMSGIGVILGLMNQYNLSTDMETVLGLSVVMNALASAALIASKIPAIPVTASLKIGALMGVVVGVSSLMVILAGAIGQIEGSEELLDTGIEILKKIGTGIGEFLGSIIGGVGKGVTSQLTAMGDNIVGFINAFSKIESSSIDGLDIFSAFVDTILTISAANLLDAIAQKLGFGTGLDNFGGQAEKFGEAMGALSDTLTKNSIDTDAIEAAVNAGQLLAELKDSIPPDPGDILKKFVFSRDLGSFGEQAKQFGEALSAMSNTLVNNPVNPSAIENAVNAGQMLSELKDNLPDDPGDLLSLITTNQNLGNFGDQARAFGEALSAMSKALIENPVNPIAIESAVNAGQMLSALKSNLEGDPGLIISAFSTNQNLGNFGDQARAFGEALSAMSKAVSGDNKIDTEAITNAKNAGAMLTELQKAIPDSKWFDGKVSLSEFGIQIQSFGNSLQLYGGYLGDVDFKQINDSLTQAKRMVALANSVADNSDNMSSGTAAFKNVKDIGTVMEDYSNSVSTLDADKVSDSITIGYRLKTFVSSLKDINTTGINNFKDAVSTLSKVELSGIQNTLNDSTKSFTTNGMSLVEALNSGVSSQQTKASNTMTTVVSSIQKSITSKNEEFKKAGVALIAMLAVGMQAQREYAINVASQIAIASANGALNPAYSYMNNNGRNLGLGLVYGVLSMQQSAYNAGFALGQAAVRGERAGQQSHSPSKATYQSGIWLGEGMINGCRDIATKVFSTGKKLGTGIVDSVSEAMQSAEDIFDSTVDVAPVITPVVDLTDIQTGAARITSMFNNPSVTPMTNIRAISGMTNNRQNGNNEDVVDAINSLRKSLDNTGNTYNNISGITYGSDTDVADAIETLVRAATIGGRR